MVMRASNPINFKRFRAGLVLMMSEPNSPMIAARGSGDRARLRRVCRFSRRRYELPSLAQHSVWYVIESVAMTSERLPRRK